MLDTRVSAGYEEGRTRVDPPSVYSCGSVRSVFSFLRDLPLSTPLINPRLEHSEALIDCPSGFCPTLVGIVLHGVPLVCIA